MMNNIEDIYSLSPSQSGLLFHSVYEPDSRVYYQQLSVGMQGSLDIMAFRNAWKALIQRHTVMRTAFLWEDLDDTYQVVQTEVTLPLVELDWRDKPELNTALEYLELDQRGEPLELNQSPLMRLCLVQLANQQWRFIWTFHHIMMDGWSLGVAMQEWFELYESFRLTKANSLPAARPYKDYIAWQAEQDLAATETFWRGQLAEVSEPTPLPDFALSSDREIDALLPYAEQQTLFNPEETRALQDFIRNERLTLNTLFQGAWALLLGHHASRTNVMFGVTVAGRPESLASADSMVGLFINTLPLQVQWATNPEINSWLRDLQERNSDMRQHAWLPLAKLKPLSQVPADRALFDSILVFENFPVANALNQESGQLSFTDPHEIQTREVQLTRGRNHFPLSLMVVPGEKLEFIFSYERKRFSDSEIKHISEQLKAILFAIVTQPAATTETLNWLTDIEGAKVLQWGTGEALPVVEDCLHGLFARNALLNPDQLAVIDRQISLTYRQLDERANRLAHELRSRGVGSGSLVALALDRSVEFVTAVLGVLKTGGAYLPLDLKQPAARLADIVADSNAALLIGLSHWPARNTVAANIPAYWLDSEAETIASNSSQAPTFTSSPDAAAYVIYTSGSTGTPKGVVVEHRAIVNYLRGIEVSFELPEAGRYAMLSTVAADLGHTQLFGALCCGGTLVLADNDISFNPLELADFLGKHHIDVLKITPSHLQGLLDAHASPALLPRHTLIFGGEALPAGLLDKVRSLAPQVRIFNHYGPTEATVGAVANFIEKTSTTSRYIPLGKPLPNRHLQIVDAQGRLVPTGVPGELYIGGNLARGYLNRPQLTQERFVQGDAKDGLRLYRTGDRVRWLTNGELMFLGRVDNQVKIRGNRIELGEVEAQVKALTPNIRQVVAQLVTVNGQQPQLVAYIVAESSLSVKKLRDDLSMRVPDYMIPAHFITLDAIPLTANGKTDYRSLPLPQERIVAESEYVAPRNDIEQILARIWQDVLKLERIGVHENFFTLGGDSILNLQIIARANQQGLKLTPKQLFEKRTIADIAAVVSGGDVSAIQTPGENRSIPLSAGQLARLDRGQLTASWRCVALGKTVDSQLVSKALAALQQQHEVLRVGLRPTGATWAQELLGHQKAPTASLHNANSTDKGELDSLANRLLETLDVAAGETIHAALIGDGNVPSASHLLVIAHPLCVDENAWPTILKDLGLALSQLACQRPVNLGQADGDFSAWANYQRARAEGDELDPAWEHWLQYAGSEVAVVDTTSPSTTSTQRLDAETSTRLNQLKNALQLDWQAIIAFALTKQIHDKALANAGLVLLDIDCGRPASEKLTANNPIVLANVDTSTVVGTLNVLTPVFLQLAINENKIKDLIAIAKQLDQQPQQGSDYGIARYLSNNAYMREPLLDLPKAQVALRVLGDWDAHIENHGVLQAITASSMTTDFTGEYALAINAWWRGGKLHLQGSGQLAEPWMPELVKELEALSDLAATSLPQPDAYHFPLCTQYSSVDSAAVDWRNVEDLYPLSPMQHGMLLHTLLQPHSGIYLMQQRYSWDGALNRTAMETTWSLLLQRHPILRTGFLWQGDNEPLQCVYRATELSFEWYDWRGLDAEAQERKLDEILADERDRGFNMAKAPLTFLRVAQLDERRFTLVRSFHHILTDAWCFGLLMEDMLSIYQSQLKQEPVARPEALPFRNYMRWLANQDATAAEAFWTAELKGLAEPTPLVVDIPAVAAQQTTAEIGDAEFTLGISQTQRLQQLCQKHQLTANTWLQGAWALLLSRYSGNSDVLIGVTVAGRPTNLTGVEDMIGLFINSLPLRVKVNNNQTVVDWLQALLAHNVELRSYEYASLVDIQRWSEIPRGQQLFNSLVVFENAPLDIGGTDQREFAIDIFEDRVHTNFPITVVAYPGDRLGIRLSYDARRFNHTTIERMLGHLVQLLTEMVGQPETEIGNLEMLTLQERQQQLVEWNQTEADFPIDQTYAALFAQQVAKNPTGIAAICGHEHLTYTELNLRVQNVAYHLLAAGVRPDSIVALMAERGLPLLVMMIATLQAGAAFQALDVNQPPQRLAELIGLSKPAVLLASTGSISLVNQLITENSSYTILLLEELWDGEDCALVSCPATPNNLAYLIFTSGSTGTPKGVMVEQRGMINNIFGKVPTLGLDTQDRIAQTASPAFDISIWQFLAAPIVGATVHILPDAIAQDPARLLDAVEQQNLTILEAVPAIIQGLLQETRQHKLASLRWLLPTGEALPPALCRSWFGQFPHIPLMNAYGPAECSDDVAFYPITTLPADDCMHMPIGRPTANNQLFILDESLRLLPVGAVGEITVAGVGVGRGYINDSERTAQAFIDHPFEPGQRFYRTGDMGRYLKDGSIEYVGRRDQQVKIRGHRIELGEIESRLQRHESLQTAAVVAVADQRGSLQLIAYYVPEVDTSLEPTTLGTYLREQLAAYMIPAHWIQLDQLPLNANGKVDRRALENRPISGKPDDQHTCVLPRSITEERLVEIWREILKLQTISVEDNFFAIGGHSLLATQVISRIRRKFDVNLPLKSLFEHGTVAALAGLIEKSQRLESNGTALDIPIAPRDTPLPLSYAQQRLWFLDKLEGPSGAYNISAAVKLTGGLNQNALEAAINLIVERHESLRTAFKMVGDEPRQIIAEYRPFDIPVRDISSESANQLDSIVQQLINEDADKPFNLAQAPMLRVTLLRLAERTHLMLLTVHHIATDAWSSDVLTREFVTAYTAYSQGKTPELAPLPIQYGDYAYWQRSPAQQQVLSRSMDHWRKQLEGVPRFLELPLDYLRPAVADYEGAVISHPVSANHIRQLKTYSQKTGSTLFMVLLNAFNSLLQRATGMHDFIVGTDLANRENSALENLIGFFVNVLPLRAQLTSGESFSTRLQNLRTDTLDAFQHQGVPFDKLVEMLQPERKPGVNPLVQVLFVMQNTPSTIAELPGLVLEELSAEQETCKFDLAVFVDEDEHQQVRVYWKYRRNLFNEQTIRHLQNGFETLIALVADNADQALEQWQWRLPSSGAQLDHAKGLVNAEDTKAARKQSKLNKLKTAKATAVSKAPEEQVKISFLGDIDENGRSLPLVIEPILTELDPVLWARESKPWVENLLRIHGGLLFRGFNLPDAPAFEAFAQAIEPSLYGQYGDLPKNKSGKNIYHSTPYPEQQMILFHNESSHLSQWPKKQWFYCEIPARKGGCTPIVDCRKVYQQLPTHILAPLEEKGLLYVRHFTDKLDVRWQDFFKTESRTEAEQQCRKSGMGFEWFGADNLRTEQLCPAVVDHPETGEKVFFNQVQLHHDACLEPEVRRNLISLFGADRLPRNVYYGDGTRISDADMEEIGRVYEACAIRFEWQQRDVIMLDNMSVAHARDPFEGERKICVAMGQMYQREDLVKTPAAHTKFDEQSAAESPELIDTL